MGSKDQYSFRTRTPVAKQREERKESPVDEIFSRSGDLSQSKVNSSTARRYWISMGEE